MVRWWPELSWLAKKSTRCESYPEGETRGSEGKEDPKWGRRNWGSSSRNFPKTKSPPWGKLLANLGGQGTLRPEAGKKPEGRKLIGSDTCTNQGMKALLEQRGGGSLVTVAYTTPIPAPKSAFSVATVGLEGASPPDSGLDSQLPVIVGGRLLPLLRSRGAAWPGPRPPPPLPRPWERESSGVARRDQAAGHTGPKFDIYLLVSLLRQENEKDICVIQISPELKYTDYFVVVSGASMRHLQAMAQYVVKMPKFLKSKSDAYVRIEGKDADDWLCVDFGIMVIHFMLPETRETYELEKLWTLGTYDDQLAEITPESRPEDFILGFPPEEEPAAWSIVEAKKK
ncbi:uncharacterized protein LOC141498591 [Macrotis lagotis]|uniref:uncharacterized protein LOC141498591 n=1 Tax=Macrotis lagotis TaxID=92651 RepID=UPI003D68233F